MSDDADEPLTFYDADDVSWEPSSLVNARLFVFDDDDEPIAGRDVTIQWDSTGAMRIVDDVSKVDGGEYSRRSGFDPNDPEVRALMEERGRAQTIAAKVPESYRDPVRAAKAAQAADPTSILDDDDEPPIDGFYRVAEEWGGGPNWLSRARPLVRPIRLDVEHIRHATAGFKYTTSVVGEAEAVFERLNELIAMGHADPGVTSAIVTASNDPLPVPSAAGLRYVPGSTSYTVETFSSDVAVDWDDSDPMMVRPIARPIARRSYHTKGRARVHFMPTLSDPAAPTKRELQNGTDLTPYVDHVRTVLDKALDQLDVHDSLRDVIRNTTPPSWFPPPGTVTTQELASQIAERIRDKYLGKPLIVPWDVT